VGNKDVFGETPGGKWNQIGGGMQEGGVGGGSKHGGKEERGGVYGGE